MKSFTLRMPDEVWTRLRFEAFNRAVSLNSLVVKAVALHLSAVHHTDSAELLGKSVISMPEFQEEQEDKTHEMREAIDSAYLNAVDTMNHRRKKDSSPKVLPRK